jgi:NAD(P)-dependent dehydrogenase (short-subunit alcohol dehydrogenase family)
MPDESIADERRTHIPAGRFGTPEELAELAAFLVSDAADWIRGEVVTLDGGEWLRGAGEFSFLLDRDIPWDRLRRGR